jgi:hypothetical protein
MHATSGDSKQNLTAAFWLSFKVSSKKARFSMGGSDEGGFIASRTWIRAVGSPDDLLPLPSYTT